MHILETFIERFSENRKFNVDSKNKAKNILNNKEWEAK